MHDDLTANGPHVQYFAGNDLIFVGEGVDPTEKRLIRFDADKQQIYFGNSETVDYSFPDGAGATNQILVNRISEGQSGLIWADQTSPANISDTDLTQTATREFYFNDFTLTFKNSFVGSDNVLSLNGSTISLGSAGEEGTGWDLNLARAGVYGKCLTSINSTTGTGWKYPWNPLDKNPEEGDGNIAMGLGVMSGFNGESGDNNVVIGNGEAGSGITTANGCVYIGKDAGATLTGSNNIIVGSNSTGAATNTPLIMIGDGATATGNGQLHIGSIAHPIGPVTADAVANVQSHKIEIWLNEVCYYLSLELKT